MKNRVPELNSHHVKLKSKDKDHQEVLSMHNIQKTCLPGLTSQIQEFEEGFKMKDQNRDGFLNKEHLHDMLVSLGKYSADAYFNAMRNEAPGSINFTFLLVVFGEKLSGIDQEDVIRNAFVCFDEDATSTIYLSC